MSIAALSSAAGASGTEAAVAGAANAAHKGGSSGYGADYAGLGSNMNQQQANSAPASNSQNQFYSTLNDAILAKGIGNEQVGPQYRLGNSMANMITGNGDVGQSDMTNTIRDYLNTSQGVQNASTLASYFGWL